MHIKRTSQFSFSFLCKKQSSYILNDFIKLEQNDNQSPACFSNILPVCQSQSKKMLVLLFLAVIFAVSGAYCGLSPRNQEILEMVNQALKERGLNYDLIHEMQALKGQLQKHDIKIENMEREISDLKLTVEDERSRNQELLNLKLKYQQQEMELSHLKAILLDQDGNKDILPAEIMVQINTDDPKTLKETINVNDKITPT